MSHLEGTWSARKYYERVKIMRRTAVALALAGAVALGFGSLPVRSAETAAPAVQSSAIPPGLVQVVTGCVIRWNSNGPYIYENSAHVCTGVTDLSVNANGSLVLDLVPGHVAVVSVTAEEDETLSQIVQAGPSGGVTDVIVKMFDRNGNVVRADSSKLRALHYGNLWLTFVNLDEAPA